MSSSFKICLRHSKTHRPVSFQASAAHYQNQLSSLGTENERLRGQLSTLSVGLGGGEQEKRLDDVAQQVVRALLSQKVSILVLETQICDASLGKSIAWDAILILVVT